MLSTWRARTRTHTGSSRTAHTIPFCLVKQRYITPSICEAEPAFEGLREVLLKMDGTICYMVFFYLAEQLFIKKHGLNWRCLTFVLKQIIRLHVAQFMLLFCSSKPWIKKSYLNFVPVQIETFIFTSLTIYPPKTHPSICRLISLENTWY